MKKITQNKPELKKFNSDYFLTIFFISFVLCSISILLAHLKIIHTNIIHILVIYISYFFIYYLLAIVHNILQPKLNGIEGFFFLLSTIIKIGLISTSILLLYKLFNIKNNKLLIIFLISYLVFTIYDIRYKIVLLNKK